MMDEHFDPVVLRLIGLLKKALPDCAEQDIFWGYHFVTGALMLTLAQTGRIDKLSGACAGPATTRRSRSGWPPSWRPVSWRSVHEKSRSRKVGHIGRACVARANSLVSE